jgi:acetolactate decarboxylase
MKKFKILTISVVLFLITVISCFGESLYQVSTVQALLKGLYQPSITVKEAKLHADTGVGCGVGIGELIALDGYYFVADGQGYMTKLKDSDGIPFLTASKFEPTIKYTVKDITSIKELEKSIEQNIKSDNIFYMIRVDGFFKQVYARSEDRINDPAKYVPLLDWMKDHENKFYFKDVKGSLIIVKAPEIAQNIGVNGYHIHFINDSRSVGGHVFDAQIEKATVQIQPLYSMNLVLPQTKEFLKTSMAAEAHEKAGFHELETSKAKQVVPAK